MRRKYAPSALSLRARLTAAIRNAAAARLAAGFVLLPSTLPPDTFVPGQSPSHEVKCLTLGQRPLSVPISLITANAVDAPIPSIRVRSTPVDPRQIHPRQLVEVRLDFKRH